MIIIAVRCMKQMHNSVNVHMLNHKEIQQWNCRPPNIAATSKEKHCIQWDYSFAQEDNLALWLKIAFNPC